MVITGAPVGAIRATDWAKVSLGDNEPDFSP
jgi:hypothetical protein